MRVPRFLFVAVGAIGACSVPDLPPQAEDSDASDAAVEDATRNDGREDSPSPERDAAAVPDATIDEAGHDAGGNEGGLDATNGGDGSPEAGECTVPETKCTGNSVETCTANGSYGAAVPCLNSTCVLGMCTGACADGATLCSGTSAVQTCVSGTWGVAKACTGQACVGDAGACSGVCSPATTRCTSDTLVQTCGTDGQWAAAKACASNQTCTGGRCVTFPSCLASGSGLTDCGAASESCCASLQVTGGTFDRTYTNPGTGPTGEADPATVTGFRLDKYEVTVGRFRQFVNAWNSAYVPAQGAGKHTHLNGGNGLNATGGGFEQGWSVSDAAYLAPTNANLNCNSGFATWTASAGNNEKLPINCVNWWESYAFCIWDGGFLPSEAEWEYASAGGSMQRAYPWGATDPGTANQYAIYDCMFPSGPAPGGACTGTLSLANIAPVGTATLGAGLWGQLDMAGNVFEWNLDWNSVNTAFANPCRDCADLTAASSAGRMSMGGGWGSDTPFLQPPQTNEGPPSTRDDLTGIRCARTP